MDVQVTVNIPQDTYRRAQRLAELTGRDVADVLADTLDLSLPSLAADVPVPLLDPAIDDDQLMALVHLTLPEEDDERLSWLLARQQADELEREEPEELARLMQRYQAYLLVQAEAMALAVQRELIPPLAP